jgi:hypothetical protein
VSATQTATSPHRSGLTALPRDGGRQPGPTPSPRTFARCWRACDRITLRDGLAVERESYFDPAPLIAAVAMTPRAWPQFLRLQARNLANNLTTRRTR